MSGIIKLFQAGEQPYTQIPNAILRDPEISSNAVRLYAYLSSHQMGYEITYEQIQRQTGMGEYAITSAKKELTRLGWLATERPVIDGKFQATSWILLDKSTRDHSRLDDSRLGDSSVDESRNNKKTNIQEKQIKKTTTRERFSENWQPGEKLRTELSAKYPDANLDFLAEQMINWIISKGKENEYKDLNATFRNWVARSAKPAEENKKRRFLN